MVRKRIGNTLKFVFHPTLNGEPIRDNLSLVITDPNGLGRDYPLSFEGDSVYVIFQGKDQRRPGVYNVALYYNKGLEGQAVVDWDAVELVPRSRME